MSTETLTRPATTARPATQRDIERELAEAFPWLDRLPCGLYELVAAYQGCVERATGRRPDVGQAVLRLSEARDRRGRC